MNRGMQWSISMMAPHTVEHQKVSLSAGVEATVNFDKPVVVYIKTDVDVQFDLAGNTVSGDSPTLTPADGWQCFDNAAVETLKLKASADGNVWLIYGA